MADLALGPDARKQPTRIKKNSAAYGQIASVTTILEYLVDGQGRRVGKLRNGVVERTWLWRRKLQPVAELDGAGNVVARFVYAEGVNAPELMVTPTATFRLVRDHLGSVREVVDAATNLAAQQLEYDAWGRVLVDTNPGFQPFGFAGGLYDPDTGLVRFGARGYDAESGRWAAKDPIGFDGGANMFAYVGSSPVTFFDPTGLVVQICHGRPRTWPLSCPFHTSGSRQTASRLVKGATPGPTHRSKITTGSQTIFIPITRVKWFRISMRLA